MRILALGTTPADARAAGAHYVPAEPGATGLVMAEPLGAGPAINLAVVEAGQMLPDLVRLEGDLLLYASARGRVLDGSIAPLAAFAMAARAAGRRFGFLGGIEAPDVPRLLALAPDLLGLGDDRATPLADMVALACSPMMPGDGPLDRLFVKDLDLALAIGAYSSEVGRTQRVRFNLEAHVRRPSRAAETMASVYSYDLLSDAVTIATARGHTAFVETLADEIARLVLLDARVEEVGVRLEKLDLGPAAVGIDIRRRRP